MGGKIFLVRGDDDLVEMKEQKYDSEARLQDLLSKYPDLLAGDQMLSASPRRFALIKPEAGVPSEDEGGDRWALDHLFVDQDGIPTMVEVKRSTDSRIRREVVGQMLDYAANGVVYWPIEEIRARFYSYWDDPGAELERLLGSEFDEEAFWETVAVNLRAGKVRLVFLADEIPAELRRIVEFLGQQMTPAEVFAVEVKQFLSEDGLQTLVPRVVAQTITPKQAVGPGKTWDEASFFAELQTEAPESVGSARRIMTWASERGLEISWGKGRQLGSFTPALLHDGWRLAMFTVWTNGTVQMNFGDMNFGDLKKHPPFDGKDARLDLLARLNADAGDKLAEDRVDKYPGFALSDVTDMDGLLATWDWALDAVRAARPTAP